MSFLHDIDFNEPSIAGENVFMSLKNRYLENAPFTGVK